MKFNPMGGNMNKMMKEARKVQERIADAGRTASAGAGSQLGRRSGYRADQWATGDLKP